MIDFPRARLNMVNAQLATNGIHSEALLEAYKTLPRETLVGDAQRQYVYMDEDLPVSGGKRWLLEPLVEAKMVQEAIRGMTGSALVLGATNLPAAAMLAAFVKSVLVIEPDAALVSRARAHLAGQDLHNVAVHEAAYTQGYAQTAPYDVIFVPGAVAAIPSILTDQLAHGGRLVCVLRETPRAQGRIVCARKLPNNAIDTTIVADAATPYLTGFEPAAGFVF